MLVSMTGFGKAQVVLNRRTYTIYIKSLNSKYIEISCKIPSFLREKEMEIRNFITSFLERGKIEVIVHADENEDDINVFVNRQVAEQYMNQINELSWKLKLSLPADFISLILKMPHVISTPNEILGENEWDHFVSAINEAIAQVQKWRITEGESIQNDFEKYCNEMLNSLSTIEQKAIFRPQKIREKLMQQLKIFQSSIEFDRNRLEQEIVYYLEKINIEEEIFRTRNHINHFIETLHEPKSNGKKLSFIAQEVLRELNTLSAKANDYEIQRSVVEMKEIIENIRQQLANIL